MNDYPSQPAERVCATPGCFGAAMPCRATCCSGSRWYCRKCAHHAQVFLDSQGVPHGSFQSRHAQLVNLISLALLSPPRKDKP